MTDSNDAPNTTGAQDAPLFSEEQTKFIKDLLSAESNKIHSHYKKEIGKLTKVSTTAVAASQDAPAGDPNDLASLYRQQNEQIKEMQRQLKDEKAATRNKDFRASLSDKLLKAGVAPSYVNHAVGYLTDIQKAARFDEELGSYVVRINGADHENLDLAVAEFVKTDDAKPYIAPRDTKGSGARNVQSQAPNQSAQGQKLSKQEYGDKLVAALEAEGY